MSHDIHFQPSGPMPGFQPQPFPITRDNTAREAPDVHLPRPRALDRYRFQAEQAPQPRSSFSNQDLQGREAHDNRWTDNQAPFDRRALGTFRAPTQIEDSPGNNRLTLTPRHNPTSSRSNMFDDGPQTFTPAFSSSIPQLHPPFDLSRNAADHQYQDPLTMGMLHQQTLQRMGATQRPAQQPAYHQTPKFDAITSLRRESRSERPESNTGGAVPSPYTPRLNQQLPSSSSELGSSSPAARVDHRRHIQRPSFFDQQAMPMLNSPPETSPPDPRLSQAPTRRQTELLHAPPIAYGIQLVSPRQELPDKFRSLFPYELFNAVQSRCFPSVYGSNENLVVSAPTGSGKTVILELAICKLALERGNENIKVVYLAPTKSLCSERSRDWEKKFKPLGLDCAELTGDTSQSEMERVGSASIIVSTPEKWDSVTRKWDDHRKLLDLVELVLIDEVHILKDIRGATLEAVVSRMKSIGGNVRFIALSATVPNSDDIARWLGRDHTFRHLPARRETFGEEIRPVKLEKFVYGYDCNGNDHVFDKFLTNKIPVLLSKHAKRKPILVFCFTRKSCETTAQALADCGSTRASDDKLWPTPSKRIPVLSHDLQDLVKFGVAFHHAGLDLQDRNAIEQNFLKGELGVICCTSTLAVGVNLPCHTVVLKGTVGYSDDSLQELSSLEVMQMLGRAGRPQFDDSATAIILTRKSNEQQYKKLVSGHEILESTLHLNLIEHLNSEIGLRTIMNLPSAKAWLGDTFLAVRLRKNPEHYRLTENSSCAQQIDDRLEEICEHDIKLLQDAELVTQGEAFKCTDYGRAMSKYMVAFTTMKALLEIPRGVKMEALITALSKAAEFQDFRFRQIERPLFREINKSPLTLYPIKETVTQTWHKVSLVIQMTLGQIQLPDTGEVAKGTRQIVAEKYMIFDRLHRLVRCVIECKGYEKDGVGTKTALELARALSAESWEGKETQLTQIPGIGPGGMRKLLGQDVRTVHDLASRDYGDIERLMTRHPPYGKKLAELLEAFPRLAMDASVTGHKKSKGEGHPVVASVRATLRYTNAKGPKQWKGKFPALTFMAETTGGELAYFIRRSAKRFTKDGSGVILDFPVPLASHRDQVQCHFSAEEIVGTIVSKVVKHNIPIEDFPKQRPVPAPPVAKEVAKRKDEPILIEDDLDDDLIRVAEDVEEENRPNKRKRDSLVEEDEENYFDDDDDEFPPIEVLIEDRERKTGQHEENEYDRRLAASQGSEAEQLELEQAESEAVKLPNGRYQCNHACSGGAMTKGGKPCSHKCCKDGTEFLRKIKPKKVKESKDARVVSATQAKVPGSQRPKAKSSQDAPRKKAKHKDKDSWATRSTKPLAKTGPFFDTNDVELKDVEVIDLSGVDDLATGQLGSVTNTQEELPDVEFSDPSNSLSDSDFLALDGLVEANAMKTPFREGARDEVLFNGISAAFDSDAAGPVSRAQSPRRPPFRDPTEYFTPGSGLSFTLPGAEVIDPIPEVIKGNDGGWLGRDGKDEKEQGPKADPDWLAGFDPVLVNFLREQNVGFV